MTLIPDWRLAHRFLTVQAAAVLVLLSVLQAEVLPLVRFAIPERYMPWVSAAFGIAIVVCRLLRQGALDPGRGVSGTGGLQ